MKFSQTLKVCGFRRTAKLSKSCLIINILEEGLKLGYLWWEGLLGQETSTFSETPGMGGGAAGLPLTESTASGRRARPTTAFGHLTTTQVSEVILGSASLGV